MTEPGQFQTEAPLGNEMQRQKPPSPPGVHPSSVLNNGPKVLRYVNEGLLTLMKDARTGGDAKYISDQVKNAFDRGAKGVLIGRVIGKQTDGNEDYLGLLFVGTGSTKEDAERDLMARKAAAENEPPDPTECTPSNPAGRALARSPELHAPPAGHNFAYNVRVAGNVTRFLGANQRNLGPIPELSLTSKHTTVEYIFFTREEWYGLLDAGGKYSSWGAKLKSFERRYIAR